MKKDYRKIDIYIKNKDNYWVYECSTTWSKTCKLAKQSFMSKAGSMLQSIPRNPPKIAPPKIAAQSRDPFI